MKNNPVIKSKNTRKERTTLACTRHRGVSAFRELRGKFWLCNKLRRRTGHPERGGRVRRAPLQEPPLQQDVAAGWNPQREGRQRPRESAHGVCGSEIQGRQTEIHCKRTDTPTAVEDVSGAKLAKLSRWPALCPNCHRRELSSQPVPASRDLFHRHQLASLLCGWRSRVHHPGMQLVQEATSSRRTPLGKRKLAMGWKAPPQTSTLQMS